MTSPLPRIPAEKRRQLAGTLGLFAVLLIAIGAVAATGSNGPVIKAFVVIAFVGAVILAMCAWGVAASVKLEREEQQHEAQVDEAALAAIAQAAAVGSPAVREFHQHAHGGCGHDHDPDELEVVGDPCGHDGHGVECSQTCDTCVLARLRPNAPVAGGRPRPRPAPVAREAARPRPTRP